MTNLIHVYEMNRKSLQQTRYLPSPIKPLEKNIVRVIHAQLLIIDQTIFGGMSLSELKTDSGTPLINNLSSVTTYCIQV